MIIYLDANFNPIDEDRATIAKVIPENGQPPYFIAVNQNSKGESDSGRYSARVAHKPRAEKRAAK